MALTGKISQLVRTPIVWTFAVKGANAVAAFAITVLLARLAGAEVVGQYTLAIATATMVGVLPMAGMDALALRTIAGDLREGKTGQARGAARWFITQTAVAVVPVVALYLAAVLFSPMAEALGAEKAALTAAAIGVASVPLFRIWLNIVRAMGLPVHGQGFEALPSLLLGGTLLAMTFAGHMPPLWMIVSLYFGGQLVASMIATLLFRQTARHWGSPVALDAQQRRALRLAGLPMMGVMLLQQFSDWFILAATTGFASAAETGAFRASLQIMALVMIIVLTAETYVAPRIGGDLRAGEITLAWRRHRRATLLMSALASPILMLAVLFPEWVLVTLFGAEFASAGAALRIMAIGQLVNALAGPIGSMMIMAGHERIQFLLVLASATVQVSLSLLLIPQLGLIGAAIAYACSVSFINIASFVMARRLIRPDATTSAKARR